MVKNIVRPGCFFCCIHSAEDFCLVLMTDPAVAYIPNGGYGPYDRGHALDVFLKANNGSESLGVVWPGSRSRDVLLVILLIYFVRRRYCVSGLVPSCGSGVSFFFPLLVILI